MRIGRSVKFAIIDVGGVFREYELDRVQPLTWPRTIGYPNLFEIQDLFWPLLIKN